MLRIHYTGDFSQKANSTVPIHQHIWGQLEFIEEGRLVLLAENREWPIETGDIVWLPSHYSHGWRSLSPVRALTFKFDYSYEGETMAKMSVRSLKDDVWLQALPRRAMEAWQDVDIMKKCSADCWLEGLLSLLHSSKEDRSNAKTISGLEAEWTRLIQDLNRATGPILGLPEMAQRTHLSPAHFRRIFEARYSTTPGRYQTERRMERATGLLQYTRLPIAHIAQQVGFADVSAFSKAFMRFYGYRPSQLRQ